MNPLSRTASPLLVALLAAAGLIVAGSALGAGDYSSGTKPSTATQPAQSTSEASKMTPSGEAKAASPSKAESPDMAFRKLDMSGRGYVSKEDTHALSGFDKAFQDNDANHDGKLTQAEFKKAWLEYTGNKQ